MITRRCFPGEGIDGRFACKIHTTMLAGTALALCIVGTSALAGTVRPETAGSIRYENRAGITDAGASRGRRRRGASGRAPAQKRRADAERPARAEAAAEEDQPRKKRRAEARAESLPLGSRREPKSNRARSVAPRRNGAPELIAAAGENSLVRNVVPKHGPGSLPLGSRRERKSSRAERRAEAGTASAG